MKIRVFFLVALTFSAVFSHFADAQQRKKEPATFEQLYDDPESVNRLFIGFQPIFGELWATNPTAGFGVEAWYFLEKSMDFRVHLRKAYGNGFDLTRFNALHNSTMDNKPFVSNHFEFGGSYHFKDFITDSETTMFLYKRNYRGTKWAALVPLDLEVSCKLRKIYAARLGGIFFDTSVDLNRIIERQDPTMYDRIKMVEDPFDVMPRNYLGEFGDTLDVNIFGNIDMKGFYVGASMTWIRNVAVDIDKHDPGVDDRMLTAFFDLMIMPWINLDNVYYLEKEYDVQEIKTIPIGARLGLDGKFNRTLSWGYGAEIGYKPGLQKGGFYSLIKITLPLYGTNLDYEVEAFEK